MINKFRNFILLFVCIASMQGLMGMNDCPTCQFPPTNPVVLQCSHVMCRECAEETFKRPRTDEPREATDTDGNPMRNENRQLIMTPQTIGNDPSTCILCRKHHHLPHGEDPCFKLEDLQRALDKLVQPPKPIAPVTQPIAPAPPQPVVNPVHNPQPPQPNPPAPPQPAVNPVHNPQPAGQPPTNTTASKTFVQKHKVAIYAASATATACCIYLAYRALTNSMNADIAAIEANTSLSAFQKKKLFEERKSLAQRLLPGFVKDMFGLRTSWS